MNKLKAFLPASVGNEHNNANHLNNNTQVAEPESPPPAQPPAQPQLQPQVGFKLTLSSNETNGNESTATVPELVVSLIGARHLPSSFGLKTVEGYMVKVKVFPGAMKYESSIVTNSWPTFGETFRFPLVTNHKSSFRVKRTDSRRNSQVRQSVPEQFFNGNFVVFTVFALLELPPGYTSSLKSKTMTFIRQGSQRLKDKPVIGKLVKDIDPPNERNSNSDPKQTAKKLTTSESQRNLGSVTYFLEPKCFNAGGTRNRQPVYSTEELWLPIKDITVTQPPLDSRMSVTSSPRGQVEVTLQLADYTEVLIEPKSPREDCSFNIEGPYSPPPLSPLSLSSDSGASQVTPFECRRGYSGGSPVPTSNSHKNRFSFDDVRRIVRSVRNREKNHKGLCLKITTAKMRCGIKVKEELESIAEKVYLKTTVLEQGVLTASWKSDPFRPSLSSRWSADQCTVVVPLTGEAALEHLSIRIGLATKSKVGKKTRLGSVLLGPKAGRSNAALDDQWRKMVLYKGSPISEWYSFEGEAS
uniref:Protein kinase c conserved region 2 n=1 Tax=Anopheles triannulatus TaxID=58253 RepID=A0A2M4ANV2_9DIPT